MQGIRRLSRWLGPTKLHAAYPEPGYAVGTPAARTCHQCKQKSRISSLNDLNKEKNILESTWVPFKWVIRVIGCFAKVAKIPCKEIVGLGIASMLGTGGILCVWAQRRDTLRFGSVGHCRDTLR